MTVLSTLPYESWLEVDHEFHRTYTSVYHVYTNNVNDGPKTAVNASGIPTYGNAYVWGNDADPFAWCCGARAKLEEWKKTRGKWTVTITHSTRPHFRCADSQIENPLDEPYLIYGSFIQFRKPAQQDNTGNAIVNTVGEPFVPALERDDSRDSLVIEKNTQTISLSLRDTFRDAVNSTAIWGLPARTVKLQQWAWRIAYQGTCDAYIQNRLEFHINTSTYPTAEAGVGWDFNVLNAGYRYKVNCSADKEERQRTIMDGRDHPRHQPTPLSSTGEILDLACGDTEFYKNFRVYPELDLHGIPFLPDPLPGPFS